MQRLSAFRFVDTVNRICWSSNWASEWRGKMTSSVAWLWADGSVWVFHKLLIYWNFLTQPSLGFTENGPRKGKYPVSLLDGSEQSWMPWLLSANEATETQITTWYNHGLKNITSETVVHRMLKHMGYNSRSPHQVPLLLDKKLRLLCRQTHWNWIKEHWKKCFLVCLDPYCKT